MRPRAARRLWVAHPDRLDADGLVAVLQRSSSFASVRRCADPSDLSRLRAGELPDLLLVDEAWVGRLIRTVAALPADRVHFMAMVVLARTIDDDLVRLALALPADGVVLKSLSGLDASAALDHVDGGHGVFPLGWSAAVSRALQVPPHSCSGLTMRELQVLELVADGLSNGEIAARLFVSTHTVKFHLRRVYAKLEVRNRVEAVSLMRATADDLDETVAGTRSQRTASRSGR